MTISDLLMAEPRIKDIIPQVSNERNWHFAYTKAKRLGRHLVGWHSENKATANQAAYDAFIEYICGKLDGVYADE